MREIKFRAWDGSEMIEWNTLRDFDNVDYIFKPDQQDWHIMQYTGLKDKNGKEVYEGDIYQTADDGDYYQVMFVKGSFCGGKSETSCNPLGWDNNEEHDFVETCLEIVGNIYEDSGLLL